MQIQKTILIAGALLLFSCSQNNTEPQSVSTKSFVLSDTMMKTIRVAEATNEYVKEELKFFGKISADKNQYIDIYPLVGGNVLSVSAELGDFVKKGQVLATIRSTEIAGFQKDLSTAKTDVAIAENNLRVAQELYAGKLNTEKDVQEANSQLKKAQDELNRTKSVNEVYNIKKGNIYYVTSPISGYVVQKDINKGMELRSDRSDNIFDIANTNQVWVIVNIAESDISKISLGMKAEISTLANPDQVFSGQIDKIFKVINPETNSMQARIVLDNPTGALIPESKATINVYRNMDQQAVAIPKEAVIFEDNRYFVVVYRSQKEVAVKEVKPIAQTGKLAYVSEGLEAGDQVITSGQLLIFRALHQ